MSSPRSLSRVLTAALALGLAAVLSPVITQSAQAAECGTTNAALNRPATASSVENGGTPAAAAVDGNTGTRWSSAFTDPQWVQVDLGSSQQVCRVTLTWEAAYGRAFQVQLSDNASTWNTVYSTTTSTGGVQNLTVAGTGRYVRVYGTARATGYGYSLWELAVNTETTGGPVVPPTDPRNPDFGPNVLVYGPGYDRAAMQTRLDQIATQMKTNQFGSERYAVLYKPGVYDADVNLRFYTQVAGLGLRPDDVRLNGHVRVEADWLQQGDNPNNLGNATQNFWRQAENLNVNLPAGQIERWAVSQAASYRRMHLSGQIHLWNGGDGWASGGLIVDSKIDGVAVSGSQQQFLTRNSNLAGGWSGSVWNMVFVGTQGAPAQHFPNPSHTTVDTSPVVREKPFLYFENGEYKVFVPALRQNARGTSWESGTPAGQSISLADFFIVKPGTPVATTNAALAQGKHLLLTPGVHHLTDTINVTRPNTVVLGLGLATLSPDTGKAAMAVSDVDGVKLAGFLIDAGVQNSPVLLQLGPTSSSASHAANPTSMHDVYLRVGGPQAGKATVSLEVNSDNVIIDHTWVWRADHGTGPTGWTANTGRNGVVVNGDNVTAYGLFVEHYQQYNTVWNGNGGRTYFYQNELPYDPPNQAAWMNGSQLGWAGYKVADSVTTHEAWGMGVYSFNQADPSIRTANGFEVPNRSGVRLHDLVTVSLGGVGTIDNVVNGIGGAANMATQQRYVVNYP
ncbi:discoidin domain-containing protein [Saccharothrix texasensis]|uniref:F5/8 type C domain-containing protein n=1 Tax=Saccharothrix texasensis TaxID=103734 RepID=A0A3N1H3E0_9PSEU|nr:discoidin domain-containing protein [Saccharothrix texasensis]ROP36936.1 F5/8 type C domain-containing protein [Saccharothrix texasensis]